MVRICPYCQQRPATAYSWHYPPGPIGWIRRALGLGERQYRSCSRCVIRTPRRP